MAVEVMVKPVWSLDVEMQNAKVMQMTKAAMWIVVTFVTLKGRAHQF
jgi:hypothetical protein